MTELPRAKFLETETLKPPLDNFPTTNPQPKIQNRVLMDEQLKVGKQHHRAKPHMPKTLRAKTNRTNPSIELSLSVKMFTKFEPKPILTHEEVQHRKKRDRWQPHS